jgi:hypothetical protein
LLLLPFFLATNWPQKLVFSTAYTTNNNNNIAREGNKDATKHPTTHPNTAQTQQ